MTIYIRYDRVNNEVVEHYNRAEDIIKSADEFYHDTFKNEESYDETLEIKTIEEAIELYEGSAFEIYVLLDKTSRRRKIMNATENKFEVGLIKEPCDECKKMMEQGIMFVSVRDGESWDNPYRTGKMCVIKEEGVKQFLSPELFEQVKKTRFAFIEDSVWTQLGLPENS